MLEHSHLTPVPPRRVVILGDRGFVAGAAAATITASGVDVLALGRDRLDLTRPDAGPLLAEQLSPTDAVLFVSAKVPCKTADSFRDNILMAHAVVAALTAKPVAHLVYVSSDAVYGEGESLVREATPTAPTSLHGAMHAAREALLRHALSHVPQAALRPSLLHGAADPHGGYGPNAFRRLAAEGKEIRLFGAGEEQRDHVFIDDAAEIIRRVLAHRSTGVLNLATGRSHSFMAVAKHAAAKATPPVATVETPRRNPIIHRHFDITETRKAFPDFVYRDLMDL
jgi:UDP-glucose 4-epimerase